TSLASLRSSRLAVHAMADCRRPAHDIDNPLFALRDISARERYSWMARISDFLIDAAYLWIITATIVVIASRIYSPAGRCRRLIFRERGWPLRRSQRVVDRTFATRCGFPGWFDGAATALAFTVLRD